MITLKKSFEVQNYLTRLLESALTILSDEDNITTTKQKHLRSKSFSEAQDEEIIVKKMVEHNYTINELIKFIDVLLGEIDKLTTAINEAKTYNGKNFDAMIAMNNKKRMVLKRYEVMYAIKPTETKTVGVANKFNANGEQVGYRYDIEAITTIDYDRNLIKKKVERLRKEINDTSDTIDAMQVNSMVYYEPVFEVGESLEDIMERYK